MYVKVKKFTENNENVTKYSLSCATFETHFLAYHNSHSHHARVERQDNRPFPSSKKSHFQSEAKCEAIDMKMIFNYDAKKLIFTTKVSHLYSSRRWDFWNSEITMAGSQCHKPGQRVQRHPFWLANTDVFPGETTTGNTSVFAGYCFRFPSHVSLLSARYWERTIRAQQGRWGATEVHVKWPWPFTLIWGLLPVTVLPESRPAALGAIIWGILEFKVFQFIALYSKTSRNYNLEGEGNSFLAAHRVCFYFRTIFPSPPRFKRFRIYRPSPITFLV